MSDSPSTKPLTNLLVAYSKASQWAGEGEAANQGAQQGEHVFPLCQRCFISSQEQDAHYLEESARLHILSDSLYLHYPRQYLYATHPFY